MTLRGGRFAAPQKISTTQNAKIIVVFPSFRQEAQQNCKKALTESRVRLRGPFTGRERRFKRLKRPVANIDGQQVPRKQKSGNDGCPPDFVASAVVGGSLTLSVFDEGTCGRRRPVRGASGSVYGLIKSLPDMSFVSITFDKCRYRLLKFGIAVGGS